jgi:hypothetical protein
MKIDGFDRTASEDPMAQLERAFIEEFLKRRGHSLADVHALPHDEATRLMKDASLYASGRLTEVESRAHYLDDMHDGLRAMPSNMVQRRGTAGKK